MGLVLRFYWFVVLLALVLINYNLTAQITYQKFITPVTPYSNEGVANDICSNGNGGYVVIGSMRPSASEPADICISNSDQDGNLIWSRTFGGQIPESGNSIIYLQDSSLIAIGTTGNPGPFQESLLMKLDIYGNLIWTNKIGSTGSLSGYSIDKTSDDGFILTGNLITNGNKDIFLIKTDSTGNVIWSKTYGDTLWQNAGCVKECVNGDFIITGSIQYLDTVFSSYDNLLMRTDNLGNVKWAKTYGEFYHSEAGIDVSETLDNGFIVAGQTTAAYGNAIILKTDSSGNVEWYNMYGGYFNPGFGGYDRSAQVIQTNDGSYLFCGAYVHLPYTFDVSALLTKIDNSGNIEWAKYYPVNNYNYSNCIYQNSNGSYVLAGAGSGNTLIIQTDSIGNSGCYDSLPNLTIQFPFNYLQGNYIMFQDTIAISNNMMVLNQNDIGIDSLICISTGLQVHTELLSAIKVYPNPFNNSTIIESKKHLLNASIEIYNVTGSLVRQINGINGEKIMITRENMKAGLYWMIIKENGMPYSGLKITIVD